MNKKFYLANAKQFMESKAKLLRGTLPQQIKGNYIRNGPGEFAKGPNILEHWFGGDGYLLKLKFSGGEMSAQGRFLNTPIHARRQLSFPDTKINPFSKIYNKFRVPNYSNPANTSVLFQEHTHSSFLAICEGGWPFLVNTEDLESKGFNNFGWIDSAFSAHPKIDPDDKTIYNIGNKFPSLRIMKTPNSLERPIAQTDLKLRQIQFIHDFCLAGEFLVIFQAPFDFSLTDMILRNKFPTTCMTLNEKLPTLVHIYKKDVLKHVKTIEMPPFFSFHFTNGYSTHSKIVVEYVRYDIESAKNLLKFVEDTPKFTQPDFSGTYKGSSTLEELSIDLKDFTTASRSMPLDGDFPVCEPQDVGKPWPHTYAIGSSSGLLLTSDTIYKFGREKQTIQKVTITGEEVLVNEPCTIRTPNQQLYILCVVNKKDRSYVHLYTGDRLELVCELELPEFVPPSFHGLFRTDHH